MKTPLCGMLTLAAIYFTAQTTTPPTGKVGINTTTPTESLDVKGHVRIQELYSENEQTGTELSETNNNKTFTATDVVTANANGVLGKKSLSSIIAAQTPNFPWRKVGTIESAVPADGLSMYSKYKTGIGDYSSNGDTIGSVFEIKSTNATSDNGQQFGLINGPYKWHLSTENTTDKSGAFTLTKRNSNENGGQARVFSLTKDSKIYLGGALSDTSGGGAKIFIDGKDGKIGINKGSADYALDVNGQAKISTLNDQDPTTTNLKMVVADANGVLGKANIPSIPTIPTEPWRQLGGTNEATANNQNIYQNGKVGIGNYTSTSSFDSDFEVSSNRNGYQIGIANGDSKWNLSTESGEERAFSITKRHPNNQGRLLSLDKDAKLYLGNTLLNTSGSGAKILVDGGQGKIGVGKNSAEYNLDVAGNAKISGLPDKGSNDTVKMVVVDNSGVLKKADIPSGNGNGVKNHTGSNDAVQCNASNAGTIHYKEGVTVNKQSTSVMGFCMKTADNKYRWFYIFGGAGTTTGSAADTPNFGDGL